MGEEIDKSFPAGVSVPRRARRWPTFANDVKRHIDVWRLSLDEAKRERLHMPKGREREFLPALIELQETPPSPAGRAVAYVIMGLVVVALLWSILGKIDIIAVARGTIVSGDRSKAIQPLENGVIKTIHVHDGQRVKAGQPLIDIDTTAGADRSRYTNEYYAALTEVARLRALMAGRDRFVPPKEADPVFVRIQKRQLRDQLAEIRALEGQARAYKTMYDEHYVSQVQYLQIEQKRAAKAQEYTAALAEAEVRAHSLAEELAKARTRAAQEHLASPIDGVVQQLSVHTVGGVVAPAQQLMVIAPLNGSIEIEAYVDNKDIGFVRENQRAEIKVESFPFTHYGTLAGRILSLSGDAVPLEKRGLFYAARVSVDHPAVRVENGKEVPLTPGMNVDVEIKTGQRRVIEYFLSPLIQSLSDSAHER